MKSHLFKKIVSVLLLLAGVLSQAQAAIVTSNFHDLGGNKWTVDLSLKNTSDVAGINEFSVYFLPVSFSNLVLIASPISWDSFVAPADVALGASGFFDSFNPRALAFGASQGGFTVGFSFVGQGAPAALPFDIVGSNFAAISSGTSVPEPSSGVLMLTACMIFGLNRKTRQGTAA